MAILVVLTISINKRPKKLQVNDYHSQRCCKLIVGKTKGGKKDVGCQFTVNIDDIDIDCKSGNVRVD